jgi:hypothetical protein
MIAFNLRAQTVATSVCGMKVQEKTRNEEAGETWCE